MPRSVRLVVLAGALAWALVGCGSSSPGNGAEVSERQVYNQEGAYVTAALNAAGIDAGPAYDSPDPTVEYCTDNAGDLDQDCVDMARTITLHGLTTPQMTTMTAAIVAYWKRSGYGQLGLAPDGLAAGAVSPGGNYGLALNPIPDGYQISATVAAVRNDHTFPTTGP